MRREQVANGGSKERGEGWADPYSDGIGNSESPPVVLIGLNFWGRKCVKTTAILFLSPRVFAPAVHATFAQMSNVYLKIYNVWEFESKLNTIGTCYDSRLQ